MLCYAKYEAKDVPAVHSQRWGEEGSAEGQRGGGGCGAYLTAGRAYELGECRTGGVRLGPARVPELRLRG